MTVLRDVEARLAQGRPVVDDFDEYVRACQQLGYAHPDLTGRAGQVHDWYDTEDGLRLEALSADAAALTVIAAATDHAVRRQAGLAAEVTAAWSGRGADTAAEFLARTQRAAATTSAAVREAAETLNSLSDALWNAVDARVGATLAIEVGRRADWLAAARTVTSGAGDRAGASELVDQQVKPFVDDVVGARWVPAMRSATAAVQDAYRAALARLQATTGVVFEVPGQLGPRWVDSAAPGDTGARSAPSASPTPSISAAPATVAPAAFSAPPPPSVAPAPSVAEPAASQPLSQTDPSAVPSSPLGDVGSLGSGASGSGLSGFGQQLADLIGGLLGGSGGDDGAELDSLGSDDSEEPDDPDDSEDDDAEEPKDESGDEDEGQPNPPVPTDPAVAAPAPPPVAAVAAEPVPTPVPPETPPPAVDSAAPPPPPPTPCEIAADELPQVGE